MCPKDVWAGTFHLESIGGVATGGSQPTKWWNTNLRPTIKGEATPIGYVTVDIDGVSSQAEVDSSGDWSFTPTADLTSGDHTITLTNGGSEIKFILVLGNENVDWNAVAAGNTSTLPTVGTYWPTVLMLVLGLGLIMTGRKFI